MPTAMPTPFAGNWPVLGCRFLRGQQRPLKGLLKCTVGAAAPATSDSVGLDLYFGQVPSRSSFALACNYLLSSQNRLLPLS